MIQLVPNNNNNNNNNNNKKKEQLKIAVAFYDLRSKIVDTFCKEPKLPLVIKMLTTGSKIYILDKFF